MTGRAWRTACNEISGVRVGFASETGKRAANEDYVAACLGRPGLVQPRHRRRGRRRRRRPQGRTRGRGDRRPQLHRRLLFPARNARRPPPRRAGAGGRQWLDLQPGPRRCPRAAAWPAPSRPIILSRRQCHVDPYRRHPRLPPERRAPGAADARTTSPAAATSRICSTAPSASRSSPASTTPPSDCGSIDRLLICSDGVHGVLGRSSPQQLLLSERTSPDEPRAQHRRGARWLPAAATTCTALVLDVVDLPPADRDELTHCDRDAADPRSA